MQSNRDHNKQGQALLDPEQLPMPTRYPVIAVRRVSTVLYKSLMTVSLWVTQTLSS